MTFLNTLVQPTTIEITTNNPTTIMTEATARTTYCPNGWRRYEKQCYLFSSDRVKIEEAEALCQKKNSQLFVPKSRIELDQIVKELKSLTHTPTYYWIGAIWDRTKIRRFPPKMRTYRNEPVSQWLAGTLTVWNKRIKRAIKNGQLAKFPNLKFIRMLDGIFQISNERGTAGVICQTVPLLPAPGQC